MKKFVGSGAKQLSRDVTNKLLELKIETVRQNCGAAAADVREIMSECYDKAIDIVEQVCDCVSEAHPSARQPEDSYFDSDELHIVVAKDRTKVYRMTKASDAFAVLNDILHGEFYRSKIKHGDPDGEFKTPLEALDAYRQFIIDLLVDYKLDLDDQ